jgi:hypothetical protein
VGKPISGRADHLESHAPALGDGLRRIGPVPGAETEQERLFADLDDQAGDEIDRNGPFLGVPVVGALGVEDE